MKIRRHVACSLVMLCGTWIDPEGAATAATDSNLDYWHESITRSTSIRPDLPRQMLWIFSKIIAPSTLNCIFFKSFLSLSSVLLPANPDVVVLCCRLLQITLSEINTSPETLNLSLKTCSNKGLSIDRLASPDSLWLTALLTIFATCVGLWSVDIWSCPNNRVKLCQHIPD